MSSPLAQRLRTVLHHRFVGRKHECEIFASALKATELPFLVLHVFGPGGVGKTTLLWEWVRLCEKAEIPVIYLDARQIEASSSSFLSTLQSLLNKITDSPLETLVSRVGRQVLLIDTYERLTSLDDWLREEFLPQLSEQTLIVLAGRYPPSSAWRTALFWQSLLYPLSLRNLSPQESRLYLSKREIPPSQHQEFLAFTHGYPLALSLLADVFAQGQDIHEVRGGSGFSSRSISDFPTEAPPDVIKTLLEKFLDEVPTQSHRMALEVCAIAHLTTEALLEEILSETPDIHEVEGSLVVSRRGLFHSLFEWLRGLSFIESGRPGVFPHDLARAVLVADLRWRHPDWYAEIHQRARAYYMTRLGNSPGQEQHRLLFDYIFLHRDNPAVRPRFTWQEQHNLTGDRPSKRDYPELIEMVTQHEGKDSAQLAAFWLARQPQGALIFRDHEQQLAGFVMIIALEQATPEEIKIDPATQATWDYLQNHAPLRPGEGATLFRFWMARDSYQAVSAVQSRIFITFVQHHHNTSGLAFTFISCAEPEFWAVMFTYADLARIETADFIVGERLYGVYGHDWRVLPPSTWQALLARREIDASAQAVVSSPMSESLIVLSQPEFMEAVQQGLRYFGQVDKLRHNPLVRSRIIEDRVNGGLAQRECVSILQILLKEAVERLRSSPREDKFYRVLYRTYLQPAPTQELAAESLNLPFSTYRRHLKAGVKRVAEQLWQQEIGG